MENREQFSEDCRQYLLMLQDVITRMASNSSNCKLWAITLLTGMMAMSSALSQFNDFLILSLIPIMAFWYLDAYYLRLERRVRNREQFFLNILRGKENCDDIKSVLYDFRPLHQDHDNKNLCYVKTKCQLMNQSVYPLYLSLIVIVLILTGGSTWLKLQTIVSFVVDAFQEQTLEILNYSI